MEKYIVLTWHAHLKQAPGLCPSMFFLLGLYLRPDLLFEEGLFEFKFYLSANVISAPHSSDVPKVPEEGVSGDAQSTDRHICHTNLQIKHDFSLVNLYLFKLGFMIWNYCIELSRETLFLCWGAVKMSMKENFLTSSSGDFSHLLYCITVLLYYW